MLSAAISEGTGGITDKFQASVMASKSVFCTPTNIAETILETSPEVALTAPVTCKQFRMWQDIVSGN